METTRALLLLKLSHDLTLPTIAAVTKTDGGLFGNLAKKGRAKSHFQILQ